MAANITAAAPQRELAYRSIDGIEVVLFWNPPTGELMVTVSDARTGAYFELSAEPEEALDVFAHPYAHAAYRGLRYESELLPAWAEAAAHGAVVTADRMGHSTT